MRLAAGIRKTDPNPKVGRPRKLAPAELVGADAEFDDEYTLNALWNAHPVWMNSRNSDWRVVSACFEASGSLSVFKQVDFLQFF
jgi:hypothetical protein